VNERESTPRADFWSALFFIILGAAIGIGAWRMDRLEAQNINPYTAPGLVPGILGVLIILFGALILVRALREGGPRGRADGAPIFPNVGRTLIVLALCLGFALGLVGHGLPFWLAAALFLFVAISYLQYPERRAHGTLLQGVLFALALAIGVSIGVSFIFEKVFLVRLP
jgi:Tripartite tricarboxylate transporter TctB family